MIPTPRCRRDEVPPLFRAMFWVVPHPFFPAYHRTHSPHQSPIGRFRVLNWVGIMGHAVAAQRGIRHTEYA